MKKLAVVASGWHYPSQFYEALSKQIIPEGWSVELYCVSHRDPSHAKEEKKDDVYGQDIRGRLDAKLYEKIITKEGIEALGWLYKEHPNTIGDWGNSNQWLAEHNYKDYDLFLFTHDDNLILHDRLFADIIEDQNFKKWHVLSNSPGMPPGSFRGSFEFFKPIVLKKMGGKFDLSETTLTREGQFTAGKDTNELFDWNTTVYPFQRFFNEGKFKVAYLSPAYRVSAYVIEGERGYVALTHGINTQYEEAGLKYLIECGVI